MDERSRSEADAGIEVEVQVAPEFAGAVSQERLRAVGEAVLRREGIPGQATLVITGDPGIWELNRAYRGVDSPTDVLSFSAQEAAGDFVAAPEASDYLGDVIVSYPRAAAQAAEHGHTVEQEMNLLIVHGILHLLGYDHAEKEEKARMWARQEAILHSL